MDPSTPAVPTQQDFETRRRELLHSLTGSLIAFVHHGVIHEDEARDIARHLLQEKESLKSPEDIRPFLENLIGQWSVFNFHLEDHDEAEKRLASDKTDDVEWSMQPSHTQIDQAYLKKKHEMVKMISTVLLEKLEKEEVDEDEAREISKYALKKLEKIELATELNELFKDLSEKWSIFKETYDRHVEGLEQDQKQDESLQQDTQKIQDLKDQLAHLSKNQ